LLTAVKLNCVLIIADGKFKYSESKESAISLSEKMTGTTQLCARIKNLNAEPWQFREYGFP
jgi:hypothetical protein